MQTCFNINIKKHDFILYNKKENKFYDKNLQVINKGILLKELYPDQKSYAEANARAYIAEQENRKIINDREHFTSAFYESTSDVFELLTKQQYESLKKYRILLTILAIF